MFWVTLSLLQVHHSGGSSSKFEWHADASCVHHLLGKLEGIPEKDLLLYFKLSALVVWAAPSTAEAHLFDDAFGNPVAFVVGDPFKRTRASVANFAVDIEVNRATF